MAASYHTRFILQTLFVALACVVFTGCQSFDFSAAERQAPAITAPVSDAKVIGQYQMQLIPSRGNPSVEKINITGPVTVQDALEVSGAIKKFGRMKISLGRIIKDKGTLLKLPVEYNVRDKTVSDDQNYQILPGDTITVSPLKSDAFSKMLKEATGGLL